MTHDWKVRVCVLWLLLAVGMSAAMLLALFEPGILRDLMAGEVEGKNAHSAGLQLSFAAFFLVPMAMAFLTLVLQDTVNRWANGVLGALFAGSCLLDVVGHLGGTFGGEPLVTLVMGLIGLLIVWHAWRWPHDQQAGQAAPRRESNLHGT